MRTIMTTLAAFGLFVGLLLASPGGAFAQEAGLVKGMILSHEGNTLTVRWHGGDTAIHLTPSTKIRGTSGSLGIRGETHSPDDLVRGLAVDIATVQSGTELTATEVTFKNADLKTAKQISAGIHDTEGRVSANARGISGNAARLDEHEDRLDNIHDFDAAGRAKVFFATGSTTLTPKGHQELHQIATQAKAIKGYRIAVVGRADSRGDPVKNQRLSEARSAAVTAYLLQACGILPGRIVPSTALGENSVADDPDPPQNLSEARRVTVTILVSKGSKAAAR